MSVIQPFDQSRITRGADNIARYDDLAPSLVHMLRATVDARGANEAVVHVGGERVDYRTLWDRASRVAGGLRALGIARGDRVAIRLGNGLDWCVAFWGIQMCGAIAVPVNTRFAEAEVQYVLDDSGSSYVFTAQAPPPDASPYAVEDLQHSDVAAIFYTSGTTGFPKGAMTTHEGFLSNIETCRRIVPIQFDGNSRALVSVPLFHVTGCNSQFLCVARTAPRRW